MKRKIYINRLSNFSHKKAQANWNRILFKTLSALMLRSFSVIFLCVCGSFSPSPHNGFRVSSNMSCIIKKYARQARVARITYSFLYTSTAVEYLIISAICYGMFRKAKKKKNHYRKEKKKECVDWRKYLPDEGYLMFCIRLLAFGVIFYFAVEILSFFFYRFSFMKIFA